MADKETIRKHVSDILDEADLNTVTAKKVRQQLEKKLDTDLTDRRKEVDEIIMDVLDEKQDQKDDSKNDDDYKSESDDDDVKEIEDKRSTRKKAPTPRKRKNRGSDSESASASDSDDDYNPSGKKGKKKRKHDSDDDGSDGDWRAPRKSKSKGTPKAKSATPKAKKAGGGGGGAGKGYTRTYKLSPELAAVMGQPEMARHEVVKKMWQIIKEKNLYDPKNKQFAICNEELLPVIGQKRFRTFGMMKQLSKHFKD